MSLLWFTEMPSVSASGLAGYHPPIVGHFPLALRRLLGTILFTHSVLTRVTTAQHATLCLTSIVIRVIDGHQDRLR